jgi:hypothetical protein
MKRPPAWPIAVAMLVAVLAVPAFSAKPTAAAKKAHREPPSQPLRVLFVGNSLTYVNDLPRMVQELSSAAGEPRSLVVKQVAEGGFTLQQHWEGGRFLQALGEASWDIVVLQEQSLLPSLSKEQRAAKMDPYAEKMDASIRAAKAKTVLFLPWAWRHGDLANHPKDTFDAMQSRLKVGYTELGHRLRAPIVPVGDAWGLAHRLRPEFKLWSDLRHPTESGTYLSACVFYGWLYHKSPLGNPFTASLEPSDSFFLQEVAAATLHDALGLAVTPRKGTYVAQRRGTGKGKGQPPASPGLNRSLSSVLTRLPEEFRESLRPESDQPGAVPAKP